MNASFDGDTIVQYADVDLGIAVAIEEGLLTPVIRAAQNKSLREISELAKDLAYRARNKRMKPEEFQGGTFTVSNLGGMGIDSFSAVINPPQGFILAVGKITKVPVIDDCDQIVVGQLHVAHHELRSSCHRRRAWRRVSERIAPPLGKSGAAIGLRKGVLKSCAGARCFPDHEIVQHLPVFIGYKFDYRRVVHETEKRRLVGDQIERIDQVVESSNDPQERFTWKLTVFPAMMCAD